MSLLDLLRLFFSVLYVNKFEEPLFVESVSSMRISFGLAVYTGGEAVYKVQVFLTLHLLEISLVVVDLLLLLLLFCVV